MPKAPKLPVFDVAELELIEEAIDTRITKLNVIHNSYDEPTRSDMISEMKGLDLLHKKVGKPLSILRAQARVAELQRELAAERRRARVK